MGDYTHVFSDRHRDETVSAFERYQGALATLSGLIDQRNRTRNSHSRPSIPPSWRRAWPNDGDGDDSRDARPDVSPENPCPFLRALVAESRVSPDVVPLAEVSGMVGHARPGSAADTRKATWATFMIGLVSNGLRPSELVENLRRGVRLNRLRNRPLDKKGVGSRILEPSGMINGGELDRLDEFAVDVTDEAGTTERGLRARRGSDDDGCELRTSGGDPTPDRPAADGRGNGQCSCD